MSYNTIHTNAAPAAVGAYSQAVACHQLVFASGQIGLDPATNTMVADDVASQAQQIFANITAVLAAADLTPKAIVKANIFLTDINDFAVVNDLYAAFVDADQPPARSAVAVAALPKGAKIEIEVIASH